MEKKTIYREAQWGLGLLLDYLENEDYLVEDEELTKNREDNIKGFKKIYKELGKLIEANDNTATLNEAKKILKKQEID